MITIEYSITLEINGLTLRGMAHKPESDGSSKSPVAILFHGITGSKIDDHFLLVRYARELAKQGIGCVRFDFSGSGESDGSFSEMTFSGEVHEGIEIVNFVKKLDWVDSTKVMLVGHSMGGAVAAQVAKEIPNDIHKVCLWAPAGNMNKLAASYFEKYPKLPNGNVDLNGLELGRGFYEDLKNRNLYHEITSYTNPVMIIHGTEDEAVPHEYGQRYYDTYVNNDRGIHLMEGVDHVFGRLSWIDELFDHSIQFLNN
ncbi:alpha/beta hydrolase [Fictibacillus sp. KIGAM418]|uniref:Alpha/beta hydrolase n=1 Tax=Fictibacillus marinisediminis TaxID=2878389 RepID=A0A9X2BC89_9BACL|nr:alpha/beta fold hydrolase [Fictibacillus marinisediminis]MCK6255490.1 alpha/beta hydrolase [Fictibacillus marinisediminis]